MEEEEEEEEGDDEEERSLLRQLDADAKREKEEEEEMMRILNGMDAHTRGMQGKTHRELEIAIAGMRDALEEEEDEMRRALGEGVLDEREKTKVTQHDIEDGKNKVAELKKEAVLLKRAGQIEEARAKLREAKSAEADLERMRHILSARSSTDDDEGTSGNGNGTVMKTETTSMDSMGLDLGSQMQLMLAEMSNAAARLESSEGSGTPAEETDETDEDPELLRQFAALQAASRIDDGPERSVHNSQEIEANISGSVASSPPPPPPPQKEREEEQEEVEVKQMEAAASAELVRTLKLQAVAAKRAGDLSRARSLLREAKQIQAAGGAS